MAAPPSQPSVSLAALAGAGFAVLAVGLELSASLLGGTPGSAYPGWLVTSAWPVPVRTAWWLLVAAGAGTGVRGLVPSWSPRGRGVVAGLGALPFVVFAVAVALGAPWATWH